VALAQLIFIFRNAEKYLKILKKFSKRKFFVKEKWRIFWGNIIIFKKKEYSESINYLADMC